MGYLSINNLYAEQSILLLKKCYALEKIHGTSTHVSWRNGNQLQFHPGGVHPGSSFEALFDKEALFAKLKEKMGVEDVTIYGEAYGGKMLRMSNTYGKSLKFVAFDVMIRDVWLSVPQAEEFVTGLGLEFVHYVEIPTTLEAINAERDADSVQAIRNGMGPGKIREGVILRPLIELRKNNNERLISKHKRDEFRETMTPREVDPEKMKILEGAEAVANEYVTAMRLDHVLDKIPKPWKMEQTPDVIKAMIEDVVREGKGEFVDTPEVRKAIGRKAAGMFKNIFQKMLEEAEK